MPSAADSRGVSHSSSLPRPPTVRRRRRHGIYRQLPPTPPIVRQRETYARFHLYGNRRDASCRDVAPTDGIDDARAARLRAIAERFSPIVRTNGVAPPRDFHDLLGACPTLYVDTFEDRTLLSVDVSRAAPVRFLPASTAMWTTIRRRALLGGIALAGVASLSGCLSRAEDEGAASTREVIAPADSVARAASPRAAPLDTLSGVVPATEDVIPRAATAAPPRRRPPVTLIDRDPVAYLRGLQLLVPVDGMTRDQLPPSSFTDSRGQRTHEAYDILAPRGTPVIAAAGGHIAKLHVSEAGGNMVYTIDRSGRFVLFYAHLDRYDPRITEGMAISRGDTLGYVGTTGNAPPGVPHLHFAIVLMDEDRRWWKGAPIDPQPLLAGDEP